MSATLSSYFPFSFSRTICSDNFSLTLVKTKQEIENMRRNCDDVKACNLDMEAKVVVFFFLGEKKNFF